MAATAGKALPSVPLPPPPQHPADGAGGARADGRGAEAFRPFCESFFFQSGVLRVRPPPPCLSISRRPVV
jgi:hypothetical protein